MLLGIFLVIVVASVVNWIVSIPKVSPKQDESYFSTVEGTFYDNPAITEAGRKILVPYDFIIKHELVFFDVPLSSPMNTLEYQGHYYQINSYRDGKYIPLMIVSTPLGRITSCIRGCEGCGSFSFNIYHAEYLTCDNCGTRWDIETVKGVSVVFMDFPLLQLPSTTSNDNVWIDILEVHFFKS